MKYVIRHESRHTMRIHTGLVRMSFEEADTLEYYLKNLSYVKDAAVYDRTGDALITYAGNRREDLCRALDEFTYYSEENKALVPEETGRALNHEYQEKIVMKILGKAGRSLFLPVPLQTAWTAAKSIRFIWKGICTLLQKGLEVPVLDAAAITASELTGDFSTAGSVMFLLELGEILEEWTYKKSVGDLARSMSLKVDQAWVRIGDEDVQMDVRKIQIGDHVLVRSSEIIPLDGKVIQGEMTVNQASMTGESVPVVKKEGSPVFAGTVVEEGECLIEVTKTSGTGKYDQIVKMIEESEKLKSSTEAKAYHLADSLVPYSLAGTAVTYLLTQNVARALAFLMVDFSCALKLAMPLSVLSAIKEAGYYSISVKGGKFMEAVANADTIVFDKTGTLTHAKPAVAQIVTFDGTDETEALQISACLEEHFPHSMANAVVEEAKRRGIHHEEMHSQVQYIVAHGISSSIYERKVIIGSYHFVFEDEHCIVPEGEEEKLAQIPDMYSHLYMAYDGRLKAVICIFDPLREEAAEVIDTLHDLGITKICMMTGDSEKTAAAVARSLNIDEYHAEVLPEDKASFVRSEHEAGRKVIMIGDGINDTPALSEADAGVAVSDGAAIARQVADITITADSLQQLVTLRVLSQALMERIQQNYRFIISFNGALIALGVLGVLPPASSALLHNTSTIVTGLASMTDLLPESRREEQVLRA